MCAGLEDTCRSAKQEAAAAFHGRSERDLEKVDDRATTLSLPQIKAA
jgi:hypothetical protein